MPSTRRPSSWAATWLRSRTVKADAWQAVFTGAAAAVALLALGVSFRSVGVSRKQLRATTRPVVVDSGTWPEISNYQRDATLGLAFAVRNVGTGPALDVVMVAMQEVHGFPQPEQRSDPCHMGVGDEQAIFVPGVVQPASNLGLEVRIFYTDVAGAEHWSAYTYWRRGDWTSPVFVDSWGLAIPVSSGCC